jgi:hypothetical protein
VVGGAGYDAAFSTYLHRLRRASVAAREQELEWLLEGIELRYAPGEDGLGRLWQSAAQGVAAALVPGTLLTRDQTEQVVVRLAVARDEAETVTALASAFLDTPQIAANA